MSDLSDGFWCPSLVNQVRGLLRRGIADDGVLKHNDAFVTNLAYTFQYLEYLNHVLTETQLHSTVRVQTQKTFVITGMSIIEAILWYVLRKHCLHKIDEWQEIGRSQSSIFRDGTSEFQIRNTLLKKLEEPVEAEMKMDSMIRKVEGKALLGVGHQVYKDLNYLKRLRNRVHIHSVQHDRDTDWYSFGDQEVKLMKKVLYGVLSSDLFKPDRKHKLIIEYLKIEEPAEKLANSIPF